jgi:hypothetical protein
VNREDLILPVNFKPSIDEFLGALRIRPAGLGAQLFTGIYDQFFVSSVDLKDEYEKFYCVEYPTLRGYLELAHEIYLSPEALEKRYILTIKRPSGIVDQAYNDNLLDVVIDCIRKMEAMHED